MEGEATAIFTQSQRRNHSLVMRATDTAAEAKKSSNQTTTCCLSLVRRKKAIDGAAVTSDPGIFLEKKKMSIVMR